MRQTLTFIPLLASVANAQQVISYLFPGGADSPGVATIESVGPSTTQFKIACPSSTTDADECGWGTGIDYTVIDSTRYQAVISYEGVSMSFECDAAAPSEAVCTVSQSSTDDTGGLMTATLTGTSANLLTATVVEGASLLSGGGATPAPSPTDSAGNAKSTGLMMASGSQPGASGRPSGSGSAHAPASTGAATRYGVEGPALVALAGAAALML